MSRLTFLVTALAASATACSLSAKLTGAGDSIREKKDSTAAKVDDARPDTAAAEGATEAAEAPKVTASEDDPREVQSAIQDLDEAEQDLAKGDIESYARTSQQYNYSFHAKKEYDSFAKAAQLKARLQALDARAVAMVGGALKARYGKGARVTTHKGPDVMEAMDRAISLCEQATDMSGSYSEGETHATRLADNVKKYEEALDRAIKADKTIIVYVGDWTGGSYADVPSRLLKCEAKIAEQRLNVEDEYVAEKPSAESTKKGCGRVYFLADGVQLGANKFAPYTRTAGGTSYPEPMECSKLPKKSKVGKEFKRAIRELEEHLGIKGLVVHEDGKPYFKEDQDDWRIHRYQQLVAYSKKFELPANPCGADEKLFCEAGGSRGANMFNRMQHHMTRAEVHAGVRVDRCKAHMKAAFGLWEEFRDFRDGLKKSGEWIEGATYKTARGEKLPEPQFVARFEKEGKLADERALGDWCTKRAKK